MKFIPATSRLSKWALVAIFIIVLSKVVAQPSQPTLPQFSVGIYGGPSLSYAAFSTHEIQKHFSPGVVVGYSAGAFVKFPLKDRYSFIAEAGFAQKGRTTNFNENWNNKTIFHMVDMAMALRKSFKIKIRENLPIDVFLGAGPNIEYVLDGHGRIKVTPGGRSSYDVVMNGTPDSDFSRNYYNNINRWLFGLDLRAGVDAPLLRNQRVYVEFRFSWGQTYIGRKNAASYLEILGFEDDLRYNLKTLHVIAYYVLDFDMKKSKMGRSTKDREVKRKRR